MKRQPIQQKLPRGFFVFVFKKEKTLFSLSWNSRTANPPVIPSYSRNTGMWNKRLQCRPARPFISDNSCGGRGAEPKANRDGDAVHVCCDKYHVYEQPTTFCRNLETRDVETGSLRPVAAQHDSGPRTEGGNNKSKHVSLSPSPPTHGRGERSSAAWVTTTHAAGRKAKL